MGDIKVAALGAAGGFLAYGPNGHCHNNRRLGDTFCFSFSVVFKDASWVVRKSLFRQRFYCISKIWDVARRPRQKNTKSQK
jgi:hypothetical protein